MKTTTTSSLLKKIENVPLLTSLEEKEKTGFLKKTESHGNGNNRSNGLLNRTEALDLEVSEFDFLSKVEKLQQEQKEDQQEEEQKKEQQEEQNLPLQEERLLSKTQTLHESESQQEEDQTHKKSEAPSIQEDAKQEYLFSGDRRPGTEPEKFHVSTRRKLEHYKAILDLLKELHSTKQLQAIWDATVYSIRRELGSENIVIFLKQEGKEKKNIFLPIAFSKQIIPSEWFLRENKSILKFIADKKKICFTKEILSATDAPRLSSLENSIFEALDANLFVPIYNFTKSLEKQELMGVIILGPALVEFDYTAENMEFLQLLSDLLSSTAKQITELKDTQEKNKLLQQSSQDYQDLISLTQKVSRVREIEGIYHLLASFLETCIGASSYSLVLLSPQEGNYQIIKAKGISHESQDRFVLSIGSSMIGMTSNLMRFYQMENFKESKELRKCYTEKDLTMMKHYWILPLIHFNWLIGFFTVHNTSNDESSFPNRRRFDRAMEAVHITTPCLANLILKQEKEVCFNSPFRPLAKHLHQILQDAIQNNFPLSIADLRISYSSGLKRIEETDDWIELFSYINRNLVSHLNEKDYMTRVDISRFAMIFHNRNKEDTENLLQNMINEFPSHTLSGRKVKYNLTILDAPSRVSELNKILAQLR